MAVFGREMMVEEENEVREKAGYKTVIGKGEGRSRGGGGEKKRIEEKTEKNRN